MINIPVSIGELFDKITILEIKITMGIKEAQNELDLLNKIKSKLDPPIYVIGLYKALSSINISLWDIENDKRKCEKDKIFNKKFIELSRSVYILNDQRAHLKKLINKYMNSEIEEYKNHEEY